MDKMIIGRETPDMDTMIIDRERDSRYGQNDHRQREIPDMDKIIIGREIPDMDKMIIGRERLQIWTK